MKSCTSLINTLIIINLLSVLLSTQCVVRNGIAKFQLASAERRSFLVSVILALNNLKIIYPTLFGWIQYISIYNILSVRYLLDLLIFRGKWCQTLLICRLRVCPLSKTIQLKFVFFVRIDKKVKSFDKNLRKVNDCHQKGIKLPREIASRNIYLTLASTEATARHYHQ